MSDILVPISPGELADKLTILRIKQARIGDPAKLTNVRLELELLGRIWQDCGCEARCPPAEIEALQQVNERLWEIEDRIRDKEAAGAFDADFIALARAVYTENDTRAAIKRRINLALGSRIMEEKSYRPYARA